MLFTLYLASADHSLLALLAAHLGSGSGNQDRPGGPSCRWFLPVVVDGPVPGGEVPEGELVRLDHLRVVGEPGVLQECGQAPLVLRETQQLRQHRALDTGVCRSWIVSKFLNVFPFQK